jgi:hypothetical protein
VYDDTESSTPAPSLPAGYGGIEIGGGIGIACTWFSSWPWLLICNRRSVVRAEVGVSARSFEGARPTGFAGVSIAGERRPLEKTRYASGIMLATKSELCLKLSRGYEV